MTKVLIIEDNDMLNTSYEMILSFNGYEVQTAFNGEEGMQKLRPFQPDIILLDYFMPVMDGPHFLSALDEEIRQRLKIILLTNFDEGSKIQEVYDLGVDAYLLKSSLAPDQLIAQIKSYCS